MLPGLLSETGRPFRLDLAETRSSADTPRRGSKRQSRTSNDAPVDLADYQSVADSRFVSNYGRNGAVLEFSAHTAGRDAKIFNIVFVPRSPYAAQQLGMGHDAAGMLGQLGEKAEFLGRQVDFLPDVADHAGDKIDLHSTDPDHGRLGFERKPMAQRGADAR